MTALRRRLGGATELLDRWKVNDWHRQSDVILELYGTAERVTQGFVKDLFGRNLVVLRPSLLRGGADGAIEGKPLINLIVAQRGTINAQPQLYVQGGEVWVRFFPSMSSGENSSFGQPAGDTELSSLYQQAREAEKHSMCAVAIRLYFEAKKMAEADQFALDVKGSLNSCKKNAIDQEIFPDPVAYAQGIDNFNRAVQALQLGNIQLAIGSFEIGATLLANVGEKGDAP